MPLQSWLFLARAAVGTFSLPAGWYWQRRCSQDNGKTSETKKPLIALSPCFRRFFMQNFFTFKEAVMVKVENNEMGWLIVMVNGVCPTAVIENMISGQKQMCLQLLTFVKRHKTPQATHHQNCGHYCWTDHVNTYEPPIMKLKIRMTQGR